MDNLLVLVSSLSCLLVFQIACGGVTVVKTIGYNLLMPVIMIYADGSAEFLFRGENSLTVKAK